ncbi:uncharacterized protein PAE49_004488 isoform 2-T2 [Odontesthes bonariensis]|uniref:uncharacterized protein LOC142378920 isoform X2 n=1 Tax=Odontesthes bonariensis TaxID=219752 RepID=UPI003F586664
MGRVCAYPGCENKMSTWTKYSFHRLPLRNRDILKLWLVALKMDPNITVPRLRRLDHRVCSAHFSPEAFNPLREKKEGQKFQHQHIKKNAVPMAAEEPTQKTEELQKKNATCQRLPRQEEQRESENKENRVQADEDEESNTSLSVGDGHYMVDLGSSSELIVDEECILELFKKCRKCNRQCTVRKNVTGLKLVVNQTCCFCQHHFRWTNLPDEDYDKDDSDSQINGQNVAMSPSSNTS